MDAKFVEYDPTRIARMNCARCGGLGRVQHGDGSVEECFCIRIPNTYARLERTLPPDLRYIYLDKSDVPTSAFSFTPEEDDDGNEEEEEGEMVMGAGKGERKKSKKKKKKPGAISNIVYDGMEQDSELHQWILGFKKAVRAYFELYPRVIAGWKNFFICGRPRSGKRKVAAILVRELIIRANVDCAFTAFASFIADLSSYETDRMTIQERYIDPVFLALYDVLPTYNKSELVVTRFADIVETRRREHRPFIFTSTHWPVDSVEPYGVGVKEMMVNDLFLEGPVATSEIQGTNEPGRLASQVFNRDRAKIGAVVGDVSKKIDKALGM